MQEKAFDIFVRIVSVIVAIALLLIAYCFGEQNAINNYKKNNEVICAYVQTDEWNIVIQTQTECFVYPITNIRVLEYQDVDYLQEMVRYGEGTVTDIN